MLEFAGENISVEYKSDSVKPETVAREIVALLNTYGGTIYIGVEDDGTVSGLNIVRKWDEWVANIVRDSINPAAAPGCKNYRFWRKTSFADSGRKRRE